MNIVLCGSMKVKGRIKQIAQELEENGYNVLLPIECMIGIDKSIASRKHFERIINEENSVILIVNEEKEGIKNYIGANTLVEIGVSYFFNKRIYLLNDIYEPFKDELEAWGVICLKGDITNVK